MVRNYKKKLSRSGDVDEDAMSCAMKEVTDKKLSIRKSAQKYDVKPSPLESRITKIRKNTSANIT